MMKSVYGSIVLLLIVSAINCDSPSASSDLKIQKIKAIRNLERRLDFLLSTEDTEENEDVLILKLEMINKLDETVNRFIWEGGNWKNTLQLKFHHHKDYMVSVLWYSSNEMVRFMGKALWCMVYVIWNTIYFAFAFTCVMWVLFIMHLVFNRLMEMAYSEG